LVGQLVSRTGGAVTTNNCGLRTHDDNQKDLRTPDDETEKLENSRRQMRVEQRTTPEGESRNGRH
jgi:hypothetical protein